MAGPPSLGGADRHRRAGGAAAPAGGVPGPGRAHGRGVHAGVPGAPAPRGHPQPRLPPPLRARQHLDARRVLQGLRRVAVDRAGGRHPPARRPHRRHHLRRLPLGALHRGAVWRGHRHRHHPAHRGDRPGLGGGRGPGPVGGGRGRPGARPRAPGPGRCWWPACWRGRRCCSGPTWWCAWASPSACCSCGPWTAPAASASGWAWRWGSAPTWSTWCWRARATWSRACSSSRCSSCGPAGGCPSRRPPTSTPASSTGPSPSAASRGPCPRPSSPCRSRCGSGSWWRPARAMVAIAVWSKRAGSPHGWRLLALSLFAAGLLPQVVQRADTAHLSWVSCVPFGLLPAFLAEAARLRGTRVAVARVAMLAPVRHHAAVPPLHLPLVRRLRGPGRQLRPVGVVGRPPGAQLLLRPAGRAGGGRGHARRRRAPDRAGRQGHRRDAATCGARPTARPTSTTCSPSSSRAPATSRWTRAWPTPTTRAWRTSCGSPTS